MVNPKGIETQYRTEKIQFFNLLLKTVQPFQSLLKNKYHSCSYVFYGKSAKFAAYGSAIWTASYAKRMNSAPMSPWRNEFQTVYDKDQLQDGVNKVGGLKKTVVDNYNYYDYFKISDPNVAGDGTVPFISGVAPKGKNGVKCIRYLETDHQNAYNVKTSQLFTLWSIVQIVKQVTCE